MSRVEDEQRFVWPPRRAELAPEAGSAGSGDRAAQTQESSWPLPRPTGWRAHVREIERVWLGLETPPLPERLAEAGWIPDPPDLYCPRCGGTVGPHDATAAGCAVCSGRSFAWERLIRLGEYDGVLRDVVHDVKFTRWRRLGVDLGRLLGHSVGLQLESVGADPHAVVVVPMPTTFRRRMVRGIDHAMTIARGVARELDAPMVNGLIREHRPSQTSLSRSERLRNLAGTIRLKRHVDVRGRLVVLVDDVTTTRASLVAASRALAGRARGARGEKNPTIAGAGAIRIWAAVAAVTPDQAGFPASKPRISVRTGAAGVSSG